MSSIAFAHEVDGEDTIGEIINGSDFLNEDLQPQRYGNCSTCGSLTVLVCLDEGILIGDRDHFSLLGTCRMFVYESAAYRYCTFCHKVFERFPPHLCWELHTVCRKNMIYNICIMDYKEYELP